MEEKIFDCGIDCLLDGVDTELCHEYLSYEIFANNLIGEYAENGEYVIKDEYKDILVGCAKVIKENSDNEYKLEATISKFNLSFILQLKKENKDLVSELFLIEEIKSDNLDFCHTHKTFIGEYRDEDNIYYMQKMFKAFNIYKKDDNKIKDFNQEDYAVKLSEKLKNNKLMQEDITTYAKDYYKEYIKNVIKVLEGTEPGGKFVLKKFSEYLKSINFDKEKGDYYKAMIRLKQLILSSHIEFNDLQKNCIKKLNDNIVTVQNVSFKKHQEKPVVTKKQEPVYGKKKDQGKSKNTNKNVTKNTGGKVKTTIEPKEKKYAKVQWENSGVYVYEKHISNKNKKENEMTF